jgi:hypothetical protein
LLGQNRGPGAQALLRARYEREKDLVVREAIATAVSLRPAERTDGTGMSQLPPSKEGA